MKTEQYNAQNKVWPKEGSHILAQFDDQTIKVYQAYKPSIGNFAVENGYFGGDYSFNRMNWIKPNFLWMMYRCGWASKLGQEVVLAITIPRPLFDEFLESAVASSFSQSTFESRQEWKDALAVSEVRWDPDHSPTGQKLDRRAIQLGLRGGALERFARDEVIQIDNVTEFVKEQSKFAYQTDFQGLETPKELIYTPKSERARLNIKLDPL